VKGRGNVDWTLVPGFAQGPVSRVARAAGVERAAVRHARAQRLIPAELTEAVLELAAELGAGAPRCDTGEVVLSPAELKALASAAGLIVRGTAAEVVRIILASRRVAQAEIDRPRKKERRIRLTNTKQPSIISGRRKQDDAHDGRSGEDAASHGADAVDMDQVRTHLGCEARSPRPGSAL
jgi:hypothetical protein